MKNIKQQTVELSCWRSNYALGFAMAAMLLPFPALAQSQSSSNAGINLSIPSGVLNPSQASQTSSGSVSTKAFSSRKDVDIAKINALRFRAIVTAPSVTNTVLGDTDGWRSTLADYGIGVNSFFSASPSVNLLQEPQTTHGKNRYIGQTPEFDTSNNYLALTWDTSHIGINGGLVTLMGCDQASTIGTYGHNAHVCQFYYDQQLFNKLLDIQAGIIENGFQYQNIYVGGSLSSGTLGPSATQGGELGLSGIGVGAPAVNIRLNEGNYYVKAGIQRSTSIHGAVYENQVANPIGLRWSEPGGGVVYAQEVGYRVSPALGRLSTWVRMDGFENTTEYTAYKGGKSTGQGASIIVDHQFTQPDPNSPSHGLYAGATYTWTNPNMAAYDEYYEVRVYDKGPFLSRPEDQAAFVANLTEVSPGYRLNLRKAGYGTTQQIINLTATYTYHIARGVFFTSGITYAIHPAPIRDDAQGNPLLFRGVLAVYF